MRVCGERMGTRDRSQASTVRKACRGCLRMSFLVRSVRLQFECVDNSWVRRNRQLRAALNVLRPLTTTRYGIEPSAPLKPEIRASERESARERRRERESVRLPITPSTPDVDSTGKRPKLLCGCPCYARALVPIFSDNDAAYSAVFGAVDPKYAVSCGLTVRCRDPSNAKNRYAPKAGQDELVGNR